MAEIAGRRSSGGLACNRDATEQTIDLQGRQTLLRPIRAEDRAQFEAFLARVDPEDLQLRFHGAVRELSQAELQRLLNVDYDRAMAFVAIGPDEVGTPEMLGVARTHADADKFSAELSLLVRSDLQGRGLGAALLGRVIRYCRSRRIRRLTADVLAHNTRMLRLRTGTASAKGWRTAERSSSRSTCEAAVETHRRLPWPSPSRRKRPCAADSQRTIFSLME